MTQTLELVIEDNLFSQLQKKATTDGADVNVVAKQAIQQYLHDEAQQKMQQEIDAYRDMHADLLENYKGQYVAVHLGQLVDHDLDQHALYLRIRQCYSDDIVLIRQVRTEPEKTWMTKTPIFERE